MADANQDTFETRNIDLTGRMGDDPHVRNITREWVHAVLPFEYHYHFSWMGVPVIQFPSDIVAMQELIWDVKPDLIIETGIARGGSLVLYASMLQLLGGDGLVVGVDIDIREHAREAIESHALADRIVMIPGSSIAEDTIREVSNYAKTRQRVLVVLDSNHTQEHVAAELQSYSQFVTPGSYIVVFDTIIDDLPDHFHQGRPWTTGRGPKVAVHDFLATHPEFHIDRTYEDKLLVTVAPDGFLRRI